MLRPSSFISGIQAKEILENSKFSPELAAGYDPDPLYQHKDGYLFSATVFSDWDDGLTAVGISKEDLPAIGVISCYESRYDLIAHRERYLLKWLNDAIPIPPAKLVTSVGLHILDDKAIKEFFETHKLLDVTPKIVKKVGTLFYRAPDGTVVSVNAPQLVRPELTEEYRNRVYIRGRFESVDHLVRWLVYWDATTIGPY